MPKPKTAMVFGTFDILHKGHLNFFEQAKDAAGPESKLIVVVGRDLNVKKAKGIFPINSENARLMGVKKQQIVDDAMLGDMTDRLKLIERIRPEMICLGYDQEEPDNLEAELKRRRLNVQILRMKPFQEIKYKSSLLRK